MTAALALALQIPLGGAPETWRLVEAERQYEAQRKDAWAALGLEALVPGLGLLYAGEAEEAALEWSGLAVGAFFLLDGGYACRWFTSSQSCAFHATTVAVGWVFLLGSRLFGLTNAPLDVVRNNRALRARLGLDEGPTLSLAPAPGGAVAGVRWRF